MNSESDAALIKVGDLTGLAKPCVTLIEKIAEAWGGICRPWQIIRVARAEAEAAIIQTHAENQIQDLKRRAQIRFEEEQMQYQVNMEAVLGKSLPHITEDAKPENISKDWLAYFFDKSRLVSDEEMQGLWSQILAGEANHAGSFSKRAMNLVGFMDKKDADAFTKLGGFVCNLHDKRWLMIYDHNHVIYQSHGVTHQLLIHLESMNLIAYRATGFAARRLPRTTAIKYFGNEGVITLSPQAQDEFIVGKALLTPLGEELFPICGSTEVKGFWEYLLSIWRKG